MMYEKCQAIFTSVSHLGMYMSRGNLLCCTYTVDNYVYNSCVSRKVVYRLIFPFCVLAHIYNAMMGSGPWRRWLDYLIDFAGY